MKHLFYTIFFLLLIFLALAGTGYLLLKAEFISIPFSSISHIISGAFIISTIVSIVFYIGKNKGEQKKIVYTFSAIGLKFLLYLAFLGIMVLLKKNTDKEFLLVFFVVYLVFTLYLLIKIVKESKSK